MKIIDPSRRQQKLPSKVKFQSALECLGMDIELRFKKFSSILDQGNPFKLISFT